MNSAAVQQSTPASNCHFGSDEKNRRPRDEQKPSYKRWSTVGFTANSNIWEELNSVFRKGIVRVVACSSELGRIKSRAFSIC